MFGNTLRLNTFEIVFSVASVAHTNCVIPLLVHIVKKTVYFKFRVKERHQLHSVDMITCSHTKFRRKVFSKRIPGIIRSIDKRTYSKFNAPMYILRAKSHIHLASRGAKQSQNVTRY